MVDQAPCPTKFTLVDHPLCLKARSTLVDQKARFTLVERAPCPSKFTLVDQVLCLNANATLVAQAPCLTLNLTLTLM